MADRLAALWRRLALPLLLAAPVAALLPACSGEPPPVKFIAEGRPARLSDWQVLRRDGERLVLNRGVQRYELNTALFTDHAHKLRTLWLPPGTQAGYQADETFDFPVGTLITKTFYYPKAGGTTTALLRQTEDARADFAGGALDLSKLRLIETRVLVRREAGWVALPYVWNAEQTEATLARTGDQLALELVDDSGAHQRFTYVVPNENQCAACHVPQHPTKQLQPIGPKARHLNRELDYPEGRENQLARLMRLGLLRGGPATPAEMPRAAAWNDANAPLAARARAYLDINCGHCHNARGPAANTALHLDAAAPEDRAMGLCKPTVAAGKGTGGRLFGIVPGAPDDSVLLFRVASTEGGVMMPELGRSSAHAEGVALLRQWIAAMKGGCGPPS